MKRSLFVVTLIGFVAVTSWWLWLQGAPLASVTQGGSGPPTVVLLHGYGSKAEDWAQLPAQWRFPSNTRLVYPQAPWRGFGPHRGWWWLHLEGYAHGDQLADMSSANPGGIRVAAGLVNDLLHHEKQPLIVGGFSQGAMVSAE